MCCCAYPHVNGTPNAYSRDGKQFMTAWVHAPTPNASDTVLCDEPGRCGNGVGDSHSFHFMVVKQSLGGFALLVRHGGGEERLTLRHRNAIVDLLPPLDSNARYAVLASLYHTLKEAMQLARNSEAHRWQQAAAEHRIKTRKQRNSGNVKVWIESAVVGGNHANG